MELSPKKKKREFPVFIVSLSNSRVPTYKQRECMHYKRRKEERSYTRGVPPMGSPSKTRTFLYRSLLQACPFFSPSLSIIPVHI